MNLSQRWNHIDWTLSNLFWSVEPATAKKGSDAKAEESWRMLVLVYLLCLSWIVLVHFLDAFFFWLLTPHEVFDILSRTSSFKPSNPDNASQFQERSFWARRPPCNFVTNGLTRTVYQNIKIQGLLKNVTKHEECKAAMIKLKSLRIIVSMYSNIFEHQFPHRLRPSSFNLESEASRYPHSQTRFQQTCWSESCRCLWMQSQKNNRGLQLCYSHRNLQHIKLQNFYRLHLMSHDPHDWLNRCPPWPNVAFDPSDPAYFKVEGGGVWWGTESCGQ